MSENELAGIGHFWGNDHMTIFGGERNTMGEKDYRKILGSLAAGEKMINLKESFE